MTKLRAEVSLRHPHRKRAARRRSWLLGTGATPAERRLVCITATFASGLALLVAVRAGVSWAWWQWLVVVVVALDVTGGAVANALGSAKLLYHRPLPAGAGLAERLLHDSRVFTAVHVQPFLLALALPDSTWVWALAVYGIALLGALLVASTPLYLARPVAFAVAVVLLLVQGLLEAPAGLDWFAGVFAIKLLLAHAVPESGYRPGDALQQRAAIIRTGSW